MNPDPGTPDLPRSKPLVRTNRSLLAWQAAWGLLADGTELPRGDVVDVMCNKAGISSRTARDILINAANNGLITVVGRDDHSRPIIKRADTEGIAL